MSISFPRPLFSRSPRAASERQIWGEFFGDLIRSAREQRHLSVAVAADRAGMPAADWEAIEAGRGPLSRERVQALAAGLDVDWVLLAGLAVICRPTGWVEGEDVSGPLYS